MPPDLIASYFTLAGNVAPFDPGAVSPHLFEDRVRAAAGAGYRGFSLESRDLAHTLKRLSLTQVKNILDDHGMVYPVMETLRGWFADGDPRRSSDSERQFLLSAAEHLGVKNLKVAGDRSGREWPLDYVTEEFACLCEDAAEAKVEITIELSPTSNLADLRTGCALVEGAGWANGGLLLDIWSVMRGKIELPEIAGVRQGIVNYAELSDGLLGTTGDYLIATTTQRLLPDEGDYPLRPFLAALEQCGYRGPFGVEMLSDKFRKMPLNIAAAQSFNATHALFSS